MAPEPLKPPVDDVDDDLDDLDDVVDQFSAMSPPSAVPPPAPPPSAVPKSTQPSGITGAGAGVSGIPEEAEFGDDFAKELQKGMESLFRELGAPPPSDPKLPESEEEKERQRKFMEKWEALLVEGMDGAIPNGVGDPLTEGLLGKGKEGETTGSSTSASGSANANAGGTDDFQSTIRAAMEKMKANENAFKGDTPDAASLEQLLASLGDGSDLPGEEDIAGVLETMMGQLMSKDVLYEPLKELSEKFPPYLDSHPELPKPEHERYAAQLVKVQALVKVFEEPNFKEDDPRVLTLMNEMQSYGAPPSEVMGPLPPGFSTAPDGSPQMPEGCVIC